MLQTIIIIILLCIIVIISLCTYNTNKHLEHMGEILNIPQHENIFCPTMISSAFKSESPILAQQQTKAKDYIHFANYNNYPLLDENDPKYSGFVKYTGIPIFSSENNVPTGNKRKNVGGNNRNICYGYSYL